ncbi:type II secretion system F family protein [Burkholderia pyrrocinia]|uniref:type II secretion system F family protein n=1 Tax=Burkholderia pyrrocinia TaxID=60550 RepID=UPI001045D336|nr:type II secretion system F family protein [Burkholderia pyrrocinia]TDA47466.1 type II secretion system F family protein [Burkholderia pyrrocinia]
MLIVIASAIGIGAVLMIIVFGMLGKQLTHVMPGEDRSYQDPLPRPLRIIWPAVRFVEFHFGHLYGAKYIEKTENRLRLTSLAFLMTARQFVSVRVVTSIVAVLLASGALLMLQKFSLFIVIGAGLLGFFYPRIWSSDVRRGHVRAVQKHLPIYLDFLTLAVEAGLNISGAIQKAVEKGPEGPLRRELEHVLRDLKSGLSRADALRRFDERQGIKEVTNLVGAIIQAERMGSGLAGTLRYQSEQRRTERFQRAEKQAMEAPVKLVFPLLMFIFPVTFIVIGFPIVMKFVQGGML